MVEVMTGNGSIKFPGANAVEREYGPQGLMGIKIYYKKNNYDSNKDIGYVSVEAKPLSWVIHEETQE